MEKRARISLRRLNNGEMHSHVTDAPDATFDFFLKD